jgi:hypothetical protein
LPRRTVAMDVSIDISANSQQQAEVQSVVRELRCTLGPDSVQVETPAPGKALLKVHVPDASVGALVDRLAQCNKAMAAHGVSARTNARVADKMYFRSLPKEIDGLKSWIVGKTDEEIAAEVQRRFAAAGYPLSEVKVEHDVSGPGYIQITLDRLGMKGDSSRAVAVIKVKGKP